MGVEPRLGSVHKIRARATSRSEVVPSVNPVCDRAWLSSPEQTIKTDPPLHHGREAVQGDLGSG